MKKLFKYPHLILVFATLMTVASLVYSYFYLGIDTNQDHLIGKDKDYLVKYENFLKDFGDWEFFYVVIEVPDAKESDATAFADKLIDRLEKFPHLYEKIHGRTDTRKLVSAANLVMDDLSYNKYTEAIQSNTNVLQNFLNSSSPNEWLMALAALLRQQDLSHSSTALAENFWPVFKNMILAPFDSKSAASLASLTIPDVLAITDPQARRSLSGHLFSPDGRLLFLRILPRKDFTRMDIVAEPLRILRQEIASLKSQGYDFSVGVTGKPVLQNDEAESTGIDSRNAGIGSFIVVALIIFVFFKSYRRSLFALFSLACGMSMTAGFITFVYGSLNLLTFAFAVILIGLGIEYGIHFLIRYQHHRIHHDDFSEAIRHTISESGSAIILGAIAAATSFLSGYFTDFEALRQLGVISGVGIILCAFAELTILPALLVLFDSKKRPAKLPRFVFLLPLLRRPALALTAFAVLSIIAIPLSRGKLFEFNLLKLQDPGLESIRYENIITEKSGFSTWFLAYQTSDLGELAKIQNAMKKLPSVLRAESILDYIRPDQQLRIKKNGELLNLLKQKPFAMQKPATLRESAEFIAEFLDNLAEKALQTGDTDAVNELMDLAALLRSKSLDTSIWSMTASGSQAFSVLLTHIKKQMTSFINPQPLTENDLPKDLLTTFKGSSNNYALTIYPKNNIWEMTELRKFIDQAKSVTPEITGAPITTYEAGIAMLGGFVLVGVLTSILVFVSLYIEFKSLGDCTVILGTLFISLLWLVACMRLGGLSINLANFFALPILIGTGIDNGIHVVHHYRRSGDWREVFAITVPAVVLCCLTTMAGFGSLSFVRHQGLASFGSVMTLGTFFIMISSCVLLPNLLVLQDRLKRG